MIAETLIGQASHPDHMKTSEARIARGIPVPRTIGTCLWCTVLASAHIQHASLIAGQMEAGFASATLLSAVAAARAVGFR